MAMTIGFDIANLKELKAQLTELNRRAIPFATRNTLNRAAFDARSEYQKLIRSELVNRNKFTANSVRVEQTRTLNLKNQMSIVGSVAPYMAKLEEGTVRPLKSRVGRPIPTGYSAGQEGQKPRTRLPRARNKLSRIKLSKKRVRVRNSKQALAIKIKQAQKSGKKEFYYEYDGGRRRGIFRLIGRGRKAKIKMLYDLTNRVVKNEPTPLLERALAEVGPRLPTIHAKSLQFQLDRLFKNR